MSITVKTETEIGLHCDDCGSSLETTNKRTAKGTILADDYLVYPCSCLTDRIKELEQELEEAKDGK